MKTKNGLKLILLIQVLTLLTRLSIIHSDFRIHVYNVSRQHSELKYLKKNLKENEVIFSVEFSKNYENKQRNEIQSAYFGHEMFMLYTAACHFKQPFPNGKHNPEFDLYILSVVIVSNETHHERDIAYCCNTKLLNFVLDKSPATNRIFFWSDGCASQFRSRYVFYSLLSYPQQVTHGTMGRPIILRVLLMELMAPQKARYTKMLHPHVVIANAEHFACYANEVCKTEALYLDRTDITEIDVEHAVYIPGTLLVHSVKRVNESTLKFYFNSPSKQPSSLVQTVN